ncbi:MAG TPA: hypothetical protein VHL09_11755, partial [Dehalococcoidia bacterium]|nr:hypothetical protein [Dehalococcoidia bacterium]
LHRSLWLITLQRTFGPLALGLIAAGTHTLLASVLTNPVSTLVTVAAFWLLWSRRWHPAIVILAGGVAMALLVWASGRP